MARLARATVSILHPLNEHVLRDFFGVALLGDHVDGDVVIPGLMPQDQLFQCSATPIPGLHYQVDIVNVLLDDFVEWIDHDVMGPIQSFIDDHHTRIFQLIFDNSGGHGKLLR